MFDWGTSYEQNYYRNNIERLASLLTPIKNSSRYINKLKRRWQMKFTLLVVEITENIVIHMI